MDKTLEVSFYTIEINKNLDILKLLLFLTMSV